VLLLDEAFASLDARLRAQVRDETLRVLQQTRVATLIVTHDAEEAMAMADRIALMQEGRIVQQGAPDDLYLRPVSRFVAEFLGEVNRLPATVRAGTASTVLGPLAAAGLPDGPAEALVRPEAIRLLDPHASVGAPAEIAACRSLGAAMLVHLALAGDAGRLRARLPPGPPWPRGGAVRVAVDPERAYVFPAAVS
jgi:iron(III) transport system ATP-binding protein